MFAFLDPPELIVLVIVVLVLFGGSQLPKLARNLGKAQEEFKRGLAEGQKEAQQGRPNEGTSESPKTDSSN
jgi:sec-independent protein translocase protein TatA